MPAKYLNSNMSSKNVTSNGSSKGATESLCFSRLCPIDVGGFNFLCQSLLGALQKGDEQKDTAIFSRRKPLISVMIHLLLLYSNISYSLQCSCCEQVHKWLRSKEVPGPSGELRSISLASGQKSHQKQGHLEGVWQFPVSSVHKQGGVSAESQVRHEEALHLPAAH